MNIFRLSGDLSHLLAIIILLLKIWRTRSCAGLSGRSQFLFALVYTTRYLDLFSYFISYYNSVMKVIFIGASYTTLYLMYMKFKATYDRNHDTFRTEFLLIPVVILALFVNHDFSRLEVLWTFSIYLESVAILPQMFLIFKKGEAETITSLYLFCLGSYRAFYILNWVYRYYTEGFYDLIAVTAGIVQTVLYCIFFFLYITRGQYPCFNQAAKYTKYLGNEVPSFHVIETPEYQDLPGKQKIPSYYINNKPPLLQKSYTIDLREPVGVHNQLFYKKHGIALNAGYLLYPHTDILAHAVNTEMDKRSMLAVWGIDPISEPLTEKVAEKMPYDAVPVSQAILEETKKEATDS